MQIPPIYWGWLPHLNPKLSILFPEILVNEQLRLYKGTVLQATDKNYEKDKDLVITITNIKYDSFHYSKTFKIEIETSSRLLDHAEIDVTLYDDGFISFDGREIKVKNVEEDDEERTIKHLIRPIYYLFRKIFETDLLTNINNPMIKDEYPDDILTITINKTNSKEEALRDVLSRLLEVCKDGVSKYKHQFTIAKDQDHGAKLLLEYCAYGNNLVEIEKEILKKDESYTKYKNSFDIYSRLATTLPNHQALIVNKEQNKKILIISVTSLLIAFCALIVSLLAGSIYCEYVKGDLLPGSLNSTILIIIAAACTIAISILITEVVSLRDK